MENNEGKRKTSLIEWLIIGLAAVGAADIIILLIKILFGHGKY